MKRNVVGVALALVVALCCSACGGALLNSIPSGSSVHAVTVMRGVARARVVHQLPLSRIGTGTESLGVFAVHPNVRVRATCAGSGTLEIDFTYAHGGHGMGGVRCLGDNTLALNSESNLGARGSGPVHITVHAPAHMKWWLDVVDRQPNF